MKLSTKIVTAVLLVVGGSGAVYAFSKHSDWGMSPAEKVEFVTERVTRKLNLDSQQQQNFATFADAVAQIMTDARSARQQQVDEIGELLQEPSFNQARALEMVQQKTQMINEKAPLVVSSLAVFLDSLNAEQKQQLRQFLEHHRRHHGHGGGH
ncbi:MAG: Spy/CpxP family protein refolding chaperone [Gammaproteobacteria bacterium]|nr:Spy/CpxP family protein refolding chaperone [Gammaproteobacteria bacterium]MDH3447271.1 Spy/CpxP family protein refolding chaperone [Gammaproteobacteria bacterium]